MTMADVANSLYPMTPREGMGRAEAWKEHMAAKAGFKRKGGLLGDRERGSVSPLDGRAAWPWSERGRPAAKGKR
jgi:hypothetical protein